MSFLHLSQEAEIHAIPITWEKWIAMVLEKWIKHKHSKIMGFLNVSREAETHTIPNHGKNEIL